MGPGDEARKSPPRLVYRELSEHRAGGLVVYTRHLLWYNQNVLKGYKKKQEKTRIIGIIEIVGRTRENKRKQEKTRKDKKRQEKTKSNKQGKEG